MNSSRSGTSLAEEFYLTTTLANGKREGKSGAQKTGKIGKETVAKGGRGRGRKREEAKEVVRKKKGSGR